MRPARAEERESRGCNRLARVWAGVRPRSSQAAPSGPLPLNPLLLRRIVAGADVFSRQSDGTTIAAQYAREGITLRPANTDRINGWAEILQLLGDPTPVSQLSKGRACYPERAVSQPSVPPRLFIHQRCGRLAETLPSMQHDPNKPEDVL